MRPHRKYTASPATFHSTKYTCVVVGRLKNRYTQPAMPIVPTSGAAGVRKVRGASGSRRRITSIATHTATNAASVPALASAAIASIGMTPAMIATSTAVRIVIRTGVPRRDTFASEAGSSPSRAITKKMRLCPNRNPSSTVGSAITALAARKVAKPGRPIPRRISASGSGLSAKAV